MTAFYDPRDPHVASHERIPVIVIRWTGVVIIRPCDLRPAGGAFARGWASCPAATTVADPTRRAGQRWRGRPLLAWVRKVRGRNLSARAAPCVGGTARAVPFDYANVAAGGKVPGLPRAFGGRGLQQSGADETFRKVGAVRWPASPPSCARFPAEGSPPPSHKSMFRLCAVRQASKRLQRGSGRPERRYRQREQQGFGRRARSLPVKLGAIVLRRPPADDHPGRFPSSVLGQAREPTAQFHHGGDAGDGAQQRRHRARRWGVVSMSCRRAALRRVPAACRCGGAGCLPVCQSHADRPFARTPPVWIRCRGQSGT